VGLVVVAGAVAYAGWRWGEPVFPRLERLVGVEAERPGADGPVPSPALAESTLARIESLQAGGEGGRLRLSGAELSSLIQFGLPGVVPPGVDQPVVRLEDDRVVLSARIARGAFPDLPSLGEVGGLLPDTVLVVMRGVLLPFGEGYAALHVERAEASRVPLPGRVIPGILSALGRVPREGLPASAIVLPLPPGLASAYVEQDQLVLVSDR
jgi:hypothetical protein